MRNARLDESLARIKIAQRNINNLRYADDTTLTAESKEELKSLLMKVKEESEKTGLKLNIQKTNIMASASITSWQIDGETVESGEGNGTPLQFSCLENPLYGGAWWATVHGVAQSRTRLSKFTFNFHFHALEKEMSKLHEDILPLGKRTVWDTG